VGCTTLGCNRVVVVCREVTVGVFIVVGTDSGGVGVGGGGGVGGGVDDVDGVEDDNGNGNGGRGVAMNFLIRERCLRGCCLSSRYISIFLCMW
jgi:hypothetical protein